MEIEELQMEIEKMLERLEIYKNEIDKDIMRLKKAIKKSIKKKI